MADSSYLVGGASRERVGRPVEPKMSPPRVGARFIGVLVILGGMFVAAGYVKIEGVFAARDLEMEAGRLQDLAQKRRERLKALEGRFSELRRGDTLSAAGMNALGMLQPDTASMETVAVAAEARQRWADAAAQVSLDDTEVNGGIQ